MFQEIFLGDENIINRKTILLHASLILFSFVFILIFSNSTSFLYPFFGGDSAVFQTIGKYWLEGFIPYKDLFDHKGPLLFLINAIGWEIYPRSGIMIPQIIFMYISLLLIWRMFELYFDSLRLRICFSAFTLIYFISRYSENSASEYSVIFISASAYYFMRFLKFEEYRSIYSFIYGFGFGACVLLRTTNGMPICCFAILSAIFLIRDRKYNDLWNNILIFFAGFMTIILPFVIYFAWNDALYDALYGTILFNTKYAINGSFHNELGVYAVEVGLNCFPLFLMIFTSAVAIVFDRKNRIPWCCLFSGIVLSIMLTKLRQYDHYYLIIVPMFPLLFVVSRFAWNKSINFLKEIWQIQGFSLKRFFWKFILLIFIPTSLIYSGFCLENYITRVCAYFKISDRETIQYAEESAEIKNLSTIIPDNEKNSFVTWGLSGYIARWVLETSLIPRERFFYNQTGFSMLDPSVKKEFFDYVEKNNPLWILYGGELKVKSPWIYIRLEDANVEKLLAEKYIFKGEVSLEEQDLKLYRLKE